MTRGGAAVCEGGVEADAEADADVEVGGSTKPIASLTEALGPAGDLEFVSAALSRELLASLGGASRSHRFE